MSWKNVSSVEGKNYSHRRQHSAILYQENKIIVFGGQLVNFYNDVYQYEILSNKWTELNCWGTIPLGRYDHR